METQTSVQSDIQALTQRIAGVEGELQAQLFLLQLILMGIAGLETAKQRSEIQEKQCQDLLEGYLQDIAPKLSAWMAMEMCSKGPFFLRVTAITATDPTAQIVWSDTITRTLPSGTPLFVDKIRHSIRVKYGTKLEGLQLRLRCYRQGKSADPGIDTRRTLRSAS